MLFIGSCYGWYIFFGSDFISSVRTFRLSPKSTCQLVMEVSRQTAKKHKAHPHIHMQAPETKWKKLSKGKKTRMNSRRRNTMGRFVKPFYKQSSSIFHNRMQSAKVCSWCLPSHKIQAEKILLLLPSSLLFWFEVMLVVLRPHFSGGFVMYGVCVCVCVCSVSCWNWMKN